MKVVTKLDLGHNFDSRIKFKIDDIIEHNKPKKYNVATRQAKSQNLITEVRRLVHDAYSIGVEQGLAKERWRALRNKEDFDKFCDSLA